MRFLGLDLGDHAPDAKTIRLFLEQLVRAGAMEKLFERFDASLRPLVNVAAGFAAVQAAVVDRA